MRRTNSCAPSVGAWKRPGETWKRRDSLRNRKLMTRTTLTTNGEEIAMSVFEDLDKNCKDLAAVCRKVKSGEGLALLDSNDNHVLFNTQSLAEELGTSAFELAQILYKHKIVI
jgi:hypothetical protein